MTMSATKYNKQMASAKSETPLVAASTAEILNSSIFAPQEQEGDQPDKVIRKRRQKRPFKKRSREIQQWVIDRAAGIATAEIEGRTVVVDLADALIVSGRHWFLLPREQNLYASTGQGVLMHRLIMGLDGPRVDHRDCNGLNCRRENLRLATQAQNLANRRKHKVGSSVFKGVRRSGKKWKATVGPRKGRKYLGTFETEEAAARAYDAEALNFYGEFARLNFPLPRAEQVKAA